MGQQATAPRKLIQDFTSHGRAKWEETVSTLKSLSLSQYNMIYKNVTKLSIRPESPP